MTNLITEENLGAWLLKCDPTSKFDLPAAIADGHRFITDWSLTPGYRSEMMTPGHKVVFWVSGNSKLMTKGIWGIGHVDGYVQDAISEGFQLADVNYWKDEQARLAVKLSVPVDIPLFDTAIGADELRAAGISDLEVQRQPQGPNPSWVSKEQLSKLDALLPTWPGTSTRAEVVSVSDIGAGFGAPSENAIVEAAAEAAVREFYRGWRCTDVSRQNVGWDLTFSHRESREIVKVEVKGVTGRRPIVLLTANEFRAAQTEPGWMLAVVTRALSDPRVVEYSAREVLELSNPYVYKVDLTP
ncbi:hypothetical protein GCM10009745_38970 [Kribbella yunnanensis]|uniref:Protein NO VEIN C-terminal domain-containing protein n=1 Tax=Kribbella yunnanensis TaxID=190194 RepID=A0ABN2HLG8_9ACTN